MVSIEKKGRTNAINTQHARGVRRVGKTLHLASSPREPRDPFNGKYRCWLTVECPEVTSTMFGDYPSVCVQSIVCLTSFGFRAPLRCRRLILDNGDCNKISLWSWGTKGGFSDVPFCRVVHMDGGLVCILEMRYWRGLIDIGDGEMRSDDLMRN